MDRRERQKRVKRLKARKRRIRGQSLAVQLREKVMKSEARAKRTREMIELGGLVAKAGLADCDRAVLLGALSKIADALGDSPRVEAWRALGQKLLRTKPAKVFVIVRFTAPIPRDLGKRLRAEGLEFDRLVREWRGTADLARVRAIAVPNGGKVDPPSA